MKMKGRLIGLVVIVLALTFIGSGDVGATNCYYFYYSLDSFGECSDSMDFTLWDHFPLALHRDGTWEAARDYLNIGFDAAGTWDVFGNAIGLETLEKAPYSLIIFQSSPLFAGTKKGTAKLLPDPYKSKAKIASAQGFFQWNDGTFFYNSCWALKKVNVAECPWISE
jgi:hypothetical protein